MLPIGYGKNAWWFRFSKYETFENENGVYIIPAQKTEINSYNPYDLADSLIADYLNYGKAVFEGLEDTEKINGAMNLVKKYGLLGVLTFSQFKNYQLSSQNPNWAIHLFYDDGEFIGEKSFQEYICELFPLPDRQPPVNLHFSNLERELLQFQKNYSERVGWIAKKAHDLYRNFRYITDFKNTNEIENIPDMEYFEKVISCNFYIKNVDLVIEYDEKSGASLNWSADSLLKMIDIMYALKLIDKKTGLANCKNCGNVFIKSRKDKEYCSDGCGNSYRVKKCNRPKR